MMKSYKSATLQPIAVLCADIKPIPVSANEAVTSKSHFSLALWHILTLTEALGAAMSVRNVTCILDISGPLLLTSILNQRFQKALVSVHYILIYKADSVCVSACVMSHKY